MGYPKKHRGRRKMGSKKEEQEKKIKKIIINGQYNKVKSISIWIFIIPFCSCKYLFNFSNSIS